MLRRGAAGAHHLSAPRPLRSRPAWQAEGESTWAYFPPFSSVKAEASTGGMGALGLGRVGALDQGALAASGGGMAVDQQTQGRSGKVDGDSRDGYLDVLDASSVQRVAAALSNSASATALLAPDTHLDRRRQVFCFCFIFAFGLSTHTHTHTNTFTGARGPTD